MTAALALRPSSAPATVAAWLAELGARTGSARTPVEYARIVERFFSVQGRVFSTAAVHAFCYAPMADGSAPSPSTVSVRRAALRSWGSFVRRMAGDASATNPADNVRAPLQRRPIPRAISVEAFRAILAASGHEDRAALLMLAFMGLRRAEIFGLARKDIVYEYDTVSRGCVRAYATIRAKGGHERRREIPPPVFEAMQASGILDGEANGPLWSVSAAGWYARLRVICARAGVPAVHPHQIRHSAAQWRRDAGATVEEVQAMLGHSNLATTARYLTRLESARDTRWESVVQLLGLEVAK